MSPPGPRSVEDVTELAQAGAVEAVLVGDLVEPRVAAAGGEAADQEDAEDAEEAEWDREGEGSGGEREAVADAGGAREVVHPEEAEEAEHQPDPDARQPDGEAPAADLFSERRERGDLGVVGDCATPSEGRT